MFTLLIHVKYELSENLRASMFIPMPFYINLEHKPQPKSSTSLIIFVYQRTRSSSKRFLTRINLKIKQQHLSDEKRIQLNNTPYILKQGMLNKMSDIQDIYLQ